MNEKNNVAIKAKTTFSDDESCTTDEAKEAVQRTVAVLIGQRLSSIAATLEGGAS